MTLILEGTLIKIGNDPDIHSDWIGAVFRVLEEAQIGETILCDCIENKNMRLLGHVTHRIRDTDEIMVLNNREALSFARKD
jgi:hypothetical protein